MFFWLSMCHYQLLQDQFNSSLSTSLFLRYQGESAEAGWDPEETWRVLGLKLQLFVFSHGVKHNPSPVVVNSGNWDWTSTTISKHFGFPLKMSVLCWLGQSFIYSFRIKQQKAKIANTEITAAAGSPPLSGDTGSGFPVFSTGLLVGSENISCKRVWI